MIAFRLHKDHFLRTNQFAQPQIILQKCTRDIYSQFVSGEFSTLPLLDSEPEVEWFYLDSARRTQTIQCRPAERLCLR